MILTASEKTDSVFIEVNAITKESFSGYELPPVGVLRDHFDAYDVFVLKATWPPAEAGKIVSYAIVSEKHGEPYIWSLATRINWRGQGLASGLLEDIETFAREKRAYGVGLTTNVNNPAQKLYFDHGYRVYQVLANYYLGSNGLYMRRELC